MTQTEAKILSKRVQDVSELFRSLEMILQRLEQERVDFDHLSDDQNIYLEAFFSKYAKLTDILQSKLFKAVAKENLEEISDVKEAIMYAHKKGLHDDDSKMIAIRQLRNNIGHDYDCSKSKNNLLEAKASLDFLKDSFKKTELALEGAIKSTLHT